MSSLERRKAPGEAWETVLAVDSGGGLSTFSLAVLDASFRQQDAFVLQQQILVGVALDGSDAAGTLFEQLTGVPMLTSMGGVVLDSPSVTIVGIPDSIHPFDLDATIFVTNLLGTEVISVAKSLVIPAHTAAGGLDWTTATPTAITGTDLVWDGEAQTIASTAGGVFIAMMRFDGTWD